MNQPVKFVCLFSVLALASACAQATSVAPAPTRTPKPTFTVVLSTPTAVLLSTATAKPTVEASTNTPQATSAMRATVTPRSATAAGAVSTASATNTAVPATAVPPTATPLPCSAGYQQYVNAQLGFSICYPAGWTVTEGEEAEQGVKWATFNPPVVDPSSGAVVKSIAVVRSPAITGSSQEEINKSIALALINKYEGKLVGWPRTLGIDGRGAIEARYEFAWPVVPQGVVTLSGWEIGFVAGGQTWAIGIGGLKEHQAELEAIHNEVLARFHLLAH